MKNSQKIRANRLIEIEMAAYRAARSAHNWNKAWIALERAHIVSQPYLGPHLANHWAMLSFAFALRDVKEVAGQIFRLALAPLGALFGRIPTGNTGRAHVSAFMTMEIPEELQRQINDAGAAN